MPRKYLVVASETPEQRESRRRDVGATSAETYAETLGVLSPGCVVDEMSCVDGLPHPSADELQQYDAVFFAGSPISMHADTAETREAADFMLTVFTSGVPAFGSCAGLQIAASAVGGSTKARHPGTEAAFARGIVKTEAGRGHPLLAGRPFAWDAPAMHSDEVGDLPPNATVLARTTGTPVQAVEIRHGAGIFWGVQYHPELTLAEIAAVLRRQAASLVEDGLAADEKAVRDHTDKIDALDAEPARRDLAWQLGLDEEITDPMRRMIEIRNFLSHADRLRDGARSAG